MMTIDQLDGWKTQTEAGEILKCSQKTIGRRAAQKKIQRVLRHVPGRKPMPVFNPDDIEAIRAEMVQVEPFPVKERGGEKALVRQTSQGGVDLLAQLLADRVSPAFAVPVAQKVFLNLKEAAEYSGLPKAWLMREIKNGKIQVIIYLTLQRQVYNHPCLCAIDPFCTPVDFVHRSSRYYCLSYFTCICLRNGRGKPTRFTQACGNRRFTRSRRF